MRRLTPVLRSSLKEAAPHIKRHLPGALVAERPEGLWVQHSKLDALGVEGIQQLASKHGLPLVRVAVAKGIQRA